jgi:hypothetical protein
VRNASEEGLLGARDELYFEIANQLGRSIVTCDQDFLRLVHARLRVGEYIPGVIFIRPVSSVGSVVRAIAALAMQGRGVGFPHQVGTVIRASVVFEHAALVRRRRTTDSQV